MKESQNKLIVYDTDEIHRKIYTVREVQVMLDRDLAEFYGVKSIRLREQVKRNINRFPEDFMFQLSESEVEFMVSQNAIPSRKHLGGYLPYAFTEQGIAALSAVLKSERAMEVSVQIIRAFVAMRKFLINNASIFLRIDNVERKQLQFEIETNEKFDKVFDAMLNKELVPSQGIFFEGQVFDAHKFVSGLIRKAEKSILLIDNYIDDTVLDLFAKRKENVMVKILSKKITKEMMTDVQKFNSQYPIVELKEFKDSHDRFMIIDNEDVYHIGASLKDLGKKWFAFSKFDKKALQILGKISEKKL
jgi:hypothetical protein